MLPLELGLRKIFVGLVEKGGGGGSDSFANRVIYVRCVCIACTYTEIR